ncbi:hypothetical protein [Trichothermofontia sp.]
MASLLLLLLFIFLVWDFYCMKRIEAGIRCHRHPEIDDLESFVEQRSEFNRGLD